MNTVVIKTLNNQTKKINPEQIRHLADSLHGTICFSNDENYEEIRSIWNAMTDYKPEMIIQCKNSSDVIKSLNFARDNQLLFSVRGGGHNIAGKSSCDQGIMIDLSLMKSVQVDADKQTAQVEPGVLLGELDKQAQEFGLATPLGINSTTGVSGLTLGGGFGWLSRKYGLTIDNLLQVDIVTATGQLIQANNQENSDLFWAVRGGGGNFGIITSFKFQLHKIGTQVLSGLLIYPFDQANQILNQYVKLAENAVDELACWSVLRDAPPLPFLDEKHHGERVIIIAACYCGDMQEGEKALEPIRAIGSPIVDVISPHEYCQWQSAFDPLLTAGARNYWKSHDFSILTEDCIRIILEFTERLPSSESEIFIAHLGGQVNKVENNATAYPHRDTEFVLNVHTRWQKQIDDDRCVAWAKAFSDKTEPFANGGVYVNFLTEEEASRVSNAYGENLENLISIKNKYDPDNVFRLNQNISPQS